MPVAIVLVAFAEQDLHRGEIRLLARRLRLRGASFGRWAELGQSGTSRREVLLMPDGMVMRHRFAPVGEREIGIGRLRALEQPRRQRILEIVESGEALDEVRLRGGRTGVLE